MVGAVAHHRTTACTRAFSKEMSAAALFPESTQLATLIFLKTKYELQKKVCMTPLGMLDGCTPYTDLHRSGSASLTATRCSPFCSEGGGSSEVLRVSPDRLQWKGIVSAESRTRDSARCSEPAPSTKSFVLTTAPLTLPLLSRKSNNTSYTAEFISDAFKKRFYRSNSTTSRQTR